MVRAPCCDKKEQKKGPWTAEEDQKLIDYIEKNGHGSWRTLPKNAGLARCGKSCRLRWTNYLRPDIKRGRFTFEEEESIIQLHSILGNKWSAIAARLPGRTDNEIKNYWNTHIRKRLLRMGIDPVTHSPRLNLLDLSSLLYNGNQLDISGLLGINPLINSELVRIASSLLSPPQSFHISTQLVQSSLSSLQTNQLQNPVQQIQAEYTTSNNSFINEAQRMQHQLHNLNVFNQADLCYQNSDQIFTENLNNFVDPTCNQSFNLMTSVVSTPTSSSMSNLNSSSLCTEDEREIFCSDLFNFKIHDMLDVADFL